MIPNPEALRAAQIVGKAQFNKTFVSMGNFGLPGAIEAAISAYLAALPPAGAAEPAACGWTLADLRAAAKARQEEWCPEVKPDLSFRGNELAGETGEACNIVKKLERERHGWRDSRATLEQLAEELADVIICADLVALTAGIDLQNAVLEKFNSTSRKNGLSTLLAAPSTPAPDADAARREAVEAEREAFDWANFVEVVDYFRTQVGMTLPFVTGFDNTEAMNRCVAALSAEEVLAPLIKEAIAAIRARAAG